MTSQTALTGNVSPIAARAHVVGAAFLGRTPALALADGTILLSGIGEETRVTAHADGAVLHAASDGRRFITGGDDGLVVSTGADGATESLADARGKWIDALALHADGAVAYAVARDVTVRDAKGGEKRWSAPTAARGLAFLPKGFRLAVSHYNGVSLWFPNAAAAPDTLEWKGSHLDVAASPDGRFIISSMQENALHGWRIADKKNMKMTGYPAKTRSLSWSPKGDWLATSGAEACIIWPFADKDGPMGKAPRECGVRPARVSRAAFHPSALVIAVGYEDGWIMLCRLTDASEILVRALPEGESGGAITALVWDGEGRRLLFGAADGAAGLLTLPA